MPLKPFRNDDEVSYVNDIRSFLRIENSPRRPAPRAAPISSHTFPVTNLKKQILGIARRITGTTKVEDKIDSLSLQNNLQLMREAIARIENRQLAQNGGPIFAHQEFRGFSQWGEDGIIQGILRSIEVEQQIFVEFGVEDYRESNTRFLLTNNGWRGLVLDGGQQNIDSIRADSIYRHYDLTADCAFLTAENVNEVFKRNKFTGDIGLLSIDIDGNDYWVWKALTVVRPAIVIVEYNHRFGHERAITIPYTSTFSRTSPGNPLVYYGASLRALYLLANRKGYSLVGCNSNGVNAFFVRNDLLSENLPPLSPAEAYVSGRHRETKNQFGEFTSMTDSECWTLLDTLPLVDVDHDYP